MSKVVWFIAGLAVGELWTGWLMHIVYVAVIVGLIISGHHPFHSC